MKVFKGFTSSLFSAYIIRQQFPLLHPNKPRIKYSKAQKKRHSNICCARRIHTRPCCPTKPWVRKYLRKADIFTYTLCLENFLPFSLCRRRHHHHKAFQARAVLTNTRRHTGHVPRAPGFFSFWGAPNWLWWNNFFNVKIILLPSQRSTVRETR